MRFHTPLLVRFCFGNYYGHVVGVARCACIAGHKSAYGRFYFNQVSVLYSNIPRCSSISFGVNINICTGHVFHAIGYWLASFVVVQAPEHRRGFRHGMQYGPEFFSVHGANSSHCNEMHHVALLCLLATHSHDIRTPFRLSTDLAWQQ